MVNADDFTIIQGWMTAEDGLNLKGNELLLFAIVYGYTHNDGNLYCTKNLQYYQEFIHATKPSVINGFASLVSKG